MIWGPCPFELVLFMGSVIYALSSSSHLASQRLLEILVKGSDGNGTHNARFSVELGVRTDKRCINSRQPVGVASNLGIYFESTKKLSRNS